MTTLNTLVSLIAETEKVLTLLLAEKTREKRIKQLLDQLLAKAAFIFHKQLKQLILKLKPEDQEILLTLLAIGQSESVFTGWEKLEDPLFAFTHLAASLKPLSHHYRSIGGLAGYQLVTLKLINKSRKHPLNQEILSPIGLHLDDEGGAVEKLVREGIKSMPLLGEVYPVGGAADRLNLRHDQTGEPLPQARLPFEGRTLFEGLIRDLMAREALYEKITGKKILTPIALMTSPEKQNTQHIKEILKENHFFGRHEDHFFLFEQPLVPLVSQEGAFATKGPLELDMKPGGHGVIWQLMHTYGVFEWFKSFDRKKLLIRQINNPLADTNGNLLALLGKGVAEKKAFGFLSCPRRVGAAEGMNVVLSYKNEDGYQSSLTNIEYTDFKERGIDDTAETEGGLYSKYPANTNILFADIKEVKTALKRLPLPGMLINLKTPVEVFSRDGIRKKSVGGRLETTMQNIADAIQDFTPTHPTTKDLLKSKTFIIFNRREKTLSATKNECKNKDCILDTPPGVWMDKQKLAYELFTTRLNYTLPPLATHENPSFIIELNPALGPLWSLMAQKIQRGKLESGSDLKIEVSEVLINNLTLDGSFHLLGSNQQGRAILKNVTIKNKGLNKSKSQPFWKGLLVHKELLEIRLGKNSEFYAEDLHFEGPFLFDVPAGHKMTVKSVKGKIKTFLKKITSPSWSWGYKFQSDDSVLLTFND